MSKTQRESVEQAVMTVVGEYTSNLSKEQMAKVEAIVCGELSDGTARLSDEARAKFDTEEKLMTYTKGMVKNWLRKSDVLNGGEKYEPKTVRGPRDEKLQELKKLRASREWDEASMAKIDAAIAQRESEISASKAKVVEINADLLPDELKSLVG